VTFLRSFGGDGFHVAELEEDDIERMAELVETYVDHFNVVRPRHVEAFAVLPAVG
jgi:uncharacterized protein